MKKFILTALIAFVSIAPSAFANQTSILSVKSAEDTSIAKLSVVYDWVNMSQVQRDKKISDYEHLLFVDDSFGVFRKQDWNKQYKQFFRDKNHREHYRQAKNGVTELEDCNLCGFYTKSGILISYALQYKNDMTHAYYYDAYGNLKYIDVMSDNYPNFPYTSKQYRKNGKLVSAIVFETRDIQYMFKENHEFRGIWNKEKMFDRDGKQLMTRTNW